MRMNENEERLFNAASKLCDELNYGVKGMDLRQLVASSIGIFGDEPEGKKRVAATYLIATVMALHIAEEAGKERESEISNLIESAIAMFEKPRDKKDVN